MILAVTCAGDVHVDRVEQALWLSGCEVFRLELDRFPRDYDFDLQLRSNWVGEIRDRTTGQSIRLDAIRAAWLRKTAPFSFRSDPLLPQEHAHAVSETEHALVGFLNSLDCYCVSHPTALRASAWKPEQLVRASRFGFAVPETLITNVPQSLTEFEPERRDVIFKVMSDGDLANDQVPLEERIAGSLPTVLVDANALEAIEAVAETPCLFQAYIDKAYELRVTVIEDQIFAARIDSQSNELTRVDSRDMSAEIAYEALMLPAYIEKKCIDFVRSYGLAFGAIDLVVDRDGRHLFLENNPQGQFLYVEELVPELQISSAIAMRLRDGKRPAR